MARKLALKELDFWPIKDNSTAFRATYKALFHYDFKFINGLLRKTIPLDPLVRIDTPTDFFLKKRKKDYCFFYGNPVFLEKGFYKATLKLHLCPGKNAKLKLKIITPSHVISQKTITRATLQRIRHASLCKNYYTFQFPFRIDTPLELIHVLMEVEGRSVVKFKEITFSSDIKSFLKKKIDEAIVRYFLRHNNRLEAFPVDKLNPEVFEFRLGYRFANALFQRGRVKQALKWYQAMLTKNPLSRTCVSKIISIYRILGDRPKVNYYNKIKGKLDAMRFGPWIFETGASLEAASFPSYATKGEHLPIKLFLRLPGVSGDVAVSLVFRQGSFTFGKPISLLKAQKDGNLYTIEDQIEIPSHAPSGKFSFYFSFSIPKRNERYRLLVEGTRTNKREIKVGEIYLD